MKRNIIFLLIYSFFLFSLSAVDGAFEVGSSVMWLHSEAYDEGDQVGNRDPDPIIYKFNMALPLYMSDNFSFSPVLSFSGTDWKWVEEHSWAIPIDNMWRDIYFMSIDLDLLLGFQINFKSFSTGLFLGPCLKLAVPLWGMDYSVREDMFTFFHQEGRFFHAKGGLNVLIPLSELFTLTFKSEATVAVYNFWVDSGLNFTDGLTVSAGFGIRFNFPQSPGLPEA